MNAQRVALAREWARVYREMGYQPLPSDPRPQDETGKEKRKKPLCHYAQWWEAPADPDLFDRFATTNLQVMTGRHWGLCVLDLDGEAAVEHVERNWRPLPRTWTSWHSGGGRASRHLWFSLPPGLTEERRRSRLWGVWDGEAREGKGDWQHHTAVELLCDRSLVMAPPSIHPKTGNPYGFLRDRSPFAKGLQRPAMLPEWVWRMPHMEAPRPGPEPELVPLARPRAQKTAGGKADWRHVLDSLPSKRYVAAQWGLRFARNGSESDGWVSVHDFDREDRNPSARFNVESGRFWRPGMGQSQTLSLFELGAEMGHYRDWSECLDALADHYGLN